MSAEIYEIAGALHKGTKQVLEDLQKMNVAVRKISDLVSDANMLRLAAQYGRTEYVLPLISSEYIYELPDIWKEEEILRLLSDITWTTPFLHKKDAKRLMAVKACVPGYVEQVNGSEAKYKNPKAVCGLYLIGNRENAIMSLKKEQDFQMYLIPKDKKDAVPCCICFGEDKILVTSINIDSCMVLVWADGKYDYRPAKFTKMQDTYFFEVESMLQEMEVEIPVYEEGNWSDKGIWAMSEWIQVGKSGFAVQEKLKCSLKIDKNKLCICGGSIGNVSWVAKDAKMTIKGLLAVRKAVDVFLENTGELDYNGFQEIGDRLKKEAEIETLLTDDLMEENEDEKMDLAVEAYVRLRLLAQAGLSQQVVDAFAKDRSIYMSKGTKGCVPLQSRFLKRCIKNFEKKNHAVAYFCVLMKEQRGIIANIFYVSDCRKKWAEERREIQKKRVTVYRENLSKKEISKKEKVQIYVINGGMVCIL